VSTLLELLRFEVPRLLRRRIVFWSLAAGVTAAALVPTLLWPESQGTRTPGWTQALLNGFFQAQLAALCGSSGAVLGAFTAALAVAVQYADLPDPQTALGLLLGLVLSAGGGLYASTASLLAVALAPKRIAAFPLAYAAVALPLLTALRLACPDQISAPYRLPVAAVLLAAAGLAWLAALRVFRWRFAMDR